ncbi:MAG: MMPL family transporter [Candidatus Microthrix sp.]|nr:MMPL family transporter [Candidatus Microthrix sp.]
MSIELEGDAAVFTTNTIDKAAENLDPAAEVTVIGAPILLKDINDYLRGGILKLGAIAVVAMILIVACCCSTCAGGCCRWVILVGVTWAFGLAGYLGIPLSLVTISGLPVMLGIGIDYAIQMHSRIEEEVLLDREDHPIQEAAVNLGPALLVVTFDAIFAFLALRFAKVPMIRDFGLLLAIGIAVICVVSIIAPLAAWAPAVQVAHQFSTRLLPRLAGTFRGQVGSLPSEVSRPLCHRAPTDLRRWPLGGVGLTIRGGPIDWVNSADDQEDQHDQGQTKSSTRRGSTSPPTTCSTRKRSTSCTTSPTSKVGNAPSPPRRARTPRRC